MPYVNSVDTTTWGSRTVQASPIDWIGLAESKAMGVVSSVDGLLSQLSGSGSTALNSAVTAIAALGKFQPQSIKIDYAPLSYTSPTFIPAGGLNVPALASVLSALSIPSFSVAPPNAPSPVSVPPAYTAALGVISPLTPVNVSGSLPSPYTPKVTTPSAPPPMTSLVFSPTSPTAPTLITLTLPSLILPTPASRPTLNAMSFPADPSFEGSATIPPFTAGDLYTKTVKAIISEGSATILDQTLVSEVDDSLIGQADYQAGYWTRCGLTLPERASAALTPTLTEKSRLQSVGVAGEQQVALSKMNSLLTQALNTLAAAAAQHLFKNHLALIKSKFEIETERINNALHLFDAAVTLYQSQCAEYALAAAIYKSELEIALIPLKQWGAEVELRTVQGAFNRQNAHLYTIQIDAERAKAEGYQTQVRALLAQAEAYQSSVQGVEAQASLIQGQLSAYGASIEAHQASVTAYKAQFENYAAQTRGISAINASKEAYLRAQDASASAVGAQAQIASSQIEMQADQLKSEAAIHTAEYSAVGWVNAAEALRATAQGGADRVKAMVWGSQMQANEVQLEGVARNAEQVVKYYTASAEAAHRVADLTLRSITAATTAAATAQQSAGHAAAAVAQGAYSAVHISAHLKGGGSVSGEWSNTDSEDIKFSDMMNQQMTATGSA